MTGPPFFARPEDGPLAAEMERLADELRRVHHRVRTHPATDPPIPWDKVDARWRSGWLACAYLVMRRERDRLRTCPDDPEADRLVSDAMRGPAR